MKLKVIAKYDNGNPCDLTLTKEKKIVAYGKTFEVEDEERANQILNTTFEGSPVVELVVEEPKEDKQEKKATTKKKKEE